MVLSDPGPGLTLMLSHILDGMNGWTPHPLPCSPLFDPTLVLGDSHCPRGGSLGQEDELLPAVAEMMGAADQSAAIRPLDPVAWFPPSSEVTRTRLERGEKAGGVPFSSTRAPHLGLRGQSPIYPRMARYMEGMTAGGIRRPESASLYHRRTPWHLSATLLP